MKFGIGYVVQCERLFLQLTGILFICSGICCTRFELIINREKKKKNRLDNRQLSRKRIHQHTHIDIYTCHAQADITEHRFEFECIPTECQITIEFTLFAALYASL